MSTSTQGETPGRTTLVGAVNVMLESTGEGAINTLEEAETSQDAATALRSLQWVHSGEQARGWSWNTSVRKFHRDNSTGEIVVPQSVIKFCPDIFVYKRRYTLRAQRVYDTFEGTHDIDIPYIEASIVELLAWDDTPELYNRYATHKAAVSFGNQILNDRAHNAFHLAEAQRAWEALLVAENSEQRPNLVTDQEGGSPFPTFHPRGAVSRRPGSGFLYD
jgi:hypothetical protein